MRKKSGEPGWAWRRLVIFPVVIFACWQLMQLKGAADTRVNDTLASGWMLLVAALVLGYAGFATAQDVMAIWATKSGLPYNPESSPAEPSPPADVTVESGAKVEVKAG